MTTPNFSYHFSCVTGLLSRIGELSKGRTPLRRHCAGESAGSALSGHARWCALLPGHARASGRPSCAVRRGSRCVEAGRQGRSSFELVPRAIGEPLRPDSADHPRADVKHAANSTATTVRRRRFPSFSARRSRCGKGDVETPALSDHLVGAGEQIGRHLEAERRSIVIMRPST